MATYTKVKVDRHGRSMYRIGNSPDTTVRFGASAFAGAPPENIELTADGLNTGKVAKVKLTAEERKALPKPTLAEKAAKAKERALAMQAKADKLAAALAAGE